MIARNSHNLSEAVILQPNPISSFTEKRHHKILEHMFRFEGSYLDLQAQLEGMNDEQALSYVDSSISVGGLELKPFDRCCYCLTIFLAVLLLFPFLLLFSERWKRYTYSAQSIDKAIYEKLAKLLKSVNLKHMSLKVNDCSFNLEKAAVLHDMVKKSALNSFAFFNQAGEYDYEDDSYSQFEANMKPLKQMTAIATDLRWGNKVAKR